jgi:hypothetical protein
MVGSLACAFPRVASAFPSARLVYVRGQGAESCPGEMELRMSVAHRLGYDPFNTGSRRTIMAVVEGNDERLTARMELVDEQGVSQGERKLEAAPDRCGDLIRALALSMSIAIDPEHTGPDSDAPPLFRFGEPASDAPRVDANDRVPPQPDEQPGAALFLRFGLGGQVGLGTAPAPAAGLLVIGSPRYRDFSFSLEYRTDATASRALASGARIESQLQTGNVAPCFHFGPGFACGAFTFGVVRATSDATRSEDDSALYAAAGIRVGTEWHLPHPLILRTHADLLGALTRHHIELDGQDVWEMPAFSGSLGLALLGSFQ